MIDLARYKTLIFDCDGVLLDSNRVKTDAFRLAAAPYGEAAADELVAHHVANGGVSRYVKFERFLSTIAPKYKTQVSNQDELPDLEGLLENYASAVRSGLATCPVASGLPELRSLTRGARWLVVSGGDQSELRQVFRERGLAELFDGGIFGSPDTKDEILSREFQGGIIQHNAVFIGDSRLDHEAATRAGTDFVFVSGWTDFSNWKEYVNRNGIHAIESLSELSQHVKGSGRIAY